MKPTTTVLFALAALLASAPGARAQQGSAAPGSLSPEVLEAARAEERRLVETIERVSRAFVAIGGGSGVIVSPDGYVLTNDHVAGSRPVGERWVVTRPGGVFEGAVMVGTDPRGDISLLKLEGPGPFPYVELADSDAARPGQGVIALGNPFGFSKDGTPHVTVGVISAVHRFQGGYSDALQSDAAINPGNSGGPLLDLEGRLLGINGRIAVRFGTRNNTGVAYAIPVNQIKAFLPHFRERGLVSHGVLPGLALEDAGGAGARVTGLRAGTRAARSGLQVGDLIVEADGRAVSGSRRFQGIVGTLPAGETLRMKVRRGGETVAVEVPLQARDRHLVTKGGFLGVRISTVESDEGGVEIEAVESGSPAEQAGLQTGDVVVRVEGEAVHDAEDFVEQVGARSPGARLRLTVVRGEERVELEATLAERPKTD